MFGICRLFIVGKQIFQMQISRQEIRRLLWDHPIDDPDPVLFRRVDVLQQAVLDRGEVSPCRQNDKMGDCDAQLID